MDRDVADVRVTIKVKHMYAVIVTVAGITGMAAIGYATLKSDVAEAKKMATELKYEVSEIRCLVQQQNNFQIYGIKPSHECKE